MSFLILSLLVQAAFIVHVIKTGRNQLWIWVLIIPGLALAGILAYLVVEILPALFRSRAAHRAGRGLRKAMDPERDLRRYESEVRVADNVASRQRYAEELVHRERYDEAIAQYREGEASAARATLDELIRHNPDFRSPTGHLLYARALEAEGNVPKALEEYAVLAPSYPGAEASVRYAQLLKAQGRVAEAQKVVRELLEQARIAPGHYRRAQRSWLDAAQRLL